MSRGCTDDARKHCTMKRTQPIVGPIFVGGPKMDVVVMNEMKLVANFCTTWLNFIYYHLQLVLSKQTKTCALCLR